MKKLFILMLATALISCKQQKVLSSNSESVRYVEVKTERKDTVLQGFNLRGQLSVPEVLEMPAHDTIKIVDPTTAAELRIWKDNYGNLVAECDDKDQVIEKLRESIVDRSTESKSEVIEKDTRTWWQKLTQLIPWWAYLVAGFILGLLLRLRL